MSKSEASLPVVDGADDLAARLRSASGLLLGLDFDGTLAPIVTDPDAATTSPAVREPLEWLTAASDVQVVICSGRALTDLRERVPVDDVVFVGNHGIELARGGERRVAPVATDARAAVATARDRLTETVEPVPGARLEDKGATLTVHVRATPADRVPQVEAAVERTVDEVAGVCLVTGKAVFEVRPAVALDKGTAMTRLEADAPDGWTTVYVGDDTTDEDAFRAVQPDGVGVYVAGGNEDPNGDFETAANYALPGQEAVAPFLAWLATER